MDELATIFFQSRTQAHVFHLKTTSYASHIALQGYYDGVIDLIDGLVEAYQGKNGLIDFKKTTSVDIDASKENIISYFDNLIKFLDLKRTDSSLADTWIQNELDTLEKLLYSTKYKLTFLS